MSSQSVLLPLEMLEQSPRHRQWINITAENGHLLSTFVAFVGRKDNTDIVIKTVRQDSSAGDL